MFLQTLENNAYPPDIQSPGLVKPKQFQHYNYDNNYSDDINNIAWHDASLWLNVVIKRRTAGLIVV